MRSLWSPTDLSPKQKKRGCFLSAMQNSHSAEKTAMKVLSANRVERRGHTRNLLGPGHNGFSDCDSRSSGVEAGHSLVAEI
jgi:hypothetical protein